MADSVWTWLYNFFDDLYDGGHHDIAEKLDSFSSLAYQKDQQAVEAIYPELVAFAKGQENKWLQVYIRHWRLQAYVNTNHDPRQLVPEVLDLLSLTAEDDVKNCPQSTCVIDDITDIYAAIDAKGFAQERHDMLVETLDGLSKQVECYQCMTMSLVDALVDLDRPEEAIAVYEQGSKDAPDLFVESHFYRYLAPMVAKAMIEAGRYQKASELLEKCRPNGQDSIAEVICLKTRVANLQKDPEKAETIFEEILSYEPVDIITEQFVLAARSFEKLNDPKRVLSLSRKLAERCASIGRTREAFDAASLTFDLSKQQNDADGCTAALEIMENMIGELNRPLGADKTLEAARAG